MDTWSIFWICLFSYWSIQAIAGAINRSTCSNCKPKNEETEEYDDD